jgi:hypothetical protein
MIQPYLQLEIRRMMFFFLEAKGDPLTTALEGKLYLKG